MSPSMQALVASYGYIGSAGTIYRQASPGWRLAIHFDDRLTVASDGRGQFVVRVVAEIGAPDGRDGKAVHFTLQKAALRQAAHEWIWLSLEIDVIVPDGMTIDDLRARPRLFERLRTLMEDVLVTLDGLPEAAAAPGPGPRLRVEARLLGDLFVSRNGFVSGDGAATSGRYRAACRSACTWVAYILLPEFAAMLRLEDTTSSNGAAASREHGLTGFSNSSDRPHRNNPVVNRAQMSAGAPVKNSGKSLKSSRALRGETIAQDNTSLPENKSVKQSEAKSARSVSGNGTAVNEISSAAPPSATEITTINGVVNSLGSPRRKTGRSAARPRALLHT